MLAVFDTDKTLAAHGDFVFVSAMMGGVPVGVFRKYIQIGGSRYLTPLNPIYTEKGVDNFQVLGTLA